jgi:hypothetical protein
MMATRLFGFYRSSDANDPEVFITGAAATLAQFPEAVVAEVVDPVHGLPSTDEWLPSIARIRVTCEAKMKPVRDHERRDRVRNDTLSQRNRPGKAPIGSTEHKRVVKSFIELGSAIVLNLEPPL